MALVANVGLRLANQALVLFVTRSHPELERLVQPAEGTAVTVKVTGKSARFWRAKFVTETISALVIDSPYWMGSLVLVAASRAGVAGSTPRLVVTVLVAPRQAEETVRLLKTPALVELAEARMMNWLRFELVWTVKPPLVPALVALVVHVTEERLVPSWLVLVIVATRTLETVAYGA